MLVYVYAADLLCKECGEKTRTRLTDKGKAPKDPNDEYNYDSDDFPRGPMEEGESDSPSHCHDCGRFLETELTDEGARYVSERIRENYTDGSGSSKVIAEWASFYSDDSRVNTSPFRDGESDDGDVESDGECEQCSTETDDVCEHGLCSACRGAPACECQSQ